MNFREFLGLGYYVSELDTFLIDFDKKHQKLSESQSHEKAKYTRIFALRDQAQISRTADEAFF